MVTSLEQLPVGAVARVEALRGGFGFLQHVRDVGIEVGRVIRKVRHEGTGPILIETSTQRVAVGHGIARRIMVKELSDEH